MIKASGVCIAMLVVSCGSDGDDKQDRDAQVEPEADAGHGGDGPECFVPDDCKESEFCSAGHACEAKHAAGGECELGFECQPGTFCLRTYEAHGICKAVPDSCPDDICTCYAADSDAFCAGPPSNCDPTGQAIYCTELR
jgi:hypothetical protein